MIRSPGRVGRAPLALRLCVLALLVGASSCEGETWRASWSLALGGAPASCEQLGASAVALVATRISDGAQRVASRPCAAGRVETSRLDVGDFLAELDLTDAQGVVLAAAPLSAVRRVTEVRSIDFGAAELAPDAAQPAQAAFFVGYGEVFGARPGCGVVDRETITVADGAGTPLAAALTWPAVGGGDRLADSAAPHACPGPTRLQILTASAPGDFKLHVEATAAGQVCFAADAVVTAARGTPAPILVTATPVATDAACAVR